MNRLFTTLVILVCSICMSCNGAENSSKDTKIETKKSSITETKEIVKSTPPNINVTVKGYTEGTVYLVGYYTGNPYIVDSTTFNSNSSFTFQNDSAYQAGYYFFNMPDNKTIQLLLDKDQEFSMTTDISDIVNTMKVDGSIDNKLMYDEFLFSDGKNTLIKEKQKEQEKYTENDAQYKALKADIDILVKEKKDYLNDIFSRYPDSFYSVFKSSGQNPELVDVKNPDGTVDTNTQVALYRRAFFNNVDFSDERLLHTPVVSNKLDRYIKQLTAQNPDSIILSAKEIIQKVEKYPDYFNYFANWITLQYEVGKTPIMDAEAIYVYMIQNYFTYEKAFWSDSTTIYRLQIRAEEMQASRMGLKGPDVVSTDQFGNTKSIYEMTDPYIVVFMYSPTCEHCQEEAPKLKAFYNEWKNKGVSVFAIALDTEKQEWVNFINSRGLTQFTNVYDPTNKSIYKKYYVDITPEIYVLNPDRKIIGKNLKVNQIETIINRDKE